LAYQMLTNVSIAFVYRDAAFRSETTSQTHLGETLQVLEEQNDWIQVRQEDGYEGWIAKFFLVEKPASWEQHDFYLHGNLVSWVYENPDEQSSTIRDITLLSRLPILERQGVWVKVLLPDAVEGWIKYAPRVVPATPEVENLLRTAFNFQGIQYQWGGRSPKGFDCSGFVQTVFGLNGVKLPRDAYQQAEVGEDVSQDFSLWEPGDLIYFSERGAKVTHVAISLGGGDFIHASGYVKLNSLNPDNKDLYIDKYAQIYTSTKRVL